MAVARAVSAVRFVWLLNQILSIAEHIYGLVSFELWIRLECMKCLIRTCSPLYEGKIGRFWATFIPALCRWGQRKQMGNYWIDHNYNCIRMGWPSGLGITLVEQEHAVWMLILFGLFDRPFRLSSANRVNVAFEFRRRGPCVKCDWNWSAPISIWIGDQFCACTRQQSRQSLSARVRGETRCAQLRRRWYLRSGWTIIGFSEREAALWFGSTFTITLCID